MTNVVLVDAGRSPVIPDDPDQPGAPAGLAQEVIGALLRRTRLRRPELTELFLADPRCLPTGCAAGEAGWTFDPPPLGLTTAVHAGSSLSLARAVRTVEERPDVVVAVAAADSGTGCSPDGGHAAALRTQRRTARAVAAGWDVTPDETTGWARSSYSRADECSVSGDFAAEIVSTTRGHLTDHLHKPDVGDSFSSRAEAAWAPGHGLDEDRSSLPARPALSASALLLTSEPNAGRLGLRPRARLRLTGANCSDTGCGIAPPRAQAVDEILGPGLGVRDLDHLEVPERFAVTPVAWVKETGLSQDVVNPRGGELAFGHLPWSGHLRALVTMLNSLEATGGRTGGLVAAEARRTTAFVLTLPHRDEG